MYCDWPEFGRCCFCLPLRRGVLTFGYINLFFSALKIGVYSFSIHHGYGGGGFLPAELCLTLYLFEVIFDAVLIYGAHKKLVKCLKAYYYFVVTTTVALVLLQLIYVFTVHGVGMILELLAYTFAELCLQIYLITLVRSLIKKLEVSGPHLYENHLQQIVSGDVKVENGVYNNTTVVPTDV